jgi:hypothetical protein
MKRTAWCRILARLREAPTPALSFYAGVGATKKADEKTSQAVCFMTEIALVRGQRFTVAADPLRPGSGAAPFTGNSQFSFPVVGADSATAAILAAGLVGLAAVG